MRLGEPLYTYTTLDSTNQRALMLLGDGASEGTTVLAQSQTQGRGQRGHTWVSTPGGIYLSVILKPQLAPAHLLQVTFWSAWGVCWALRRRGIPARLKWPNDLMVAGRKLGGVLTESRVQGNLVMGCVVGVGLNGNNQVPTTAITLQELGSFDYERDYQLVLRGLTVGYQLWQRHGFARICTYYRRWWVNWGQQVPEGVITDLDELGRVGVSGVYYYPGQIQLEVKGDAIQPGHLL
ncbi:biotin--[acetyl-CoA-carboxylase] ligase [Candidatus Cyanaurora vandensis]|uniref:biotin--[acetyl-CoA-carboxylase] ligase n=1 Tax=Candidatus Cyanaurora vandensis TaxID=2714958 RepID=UPI00257D3ECD|nr:biotin--[acetyl-CoA-carboxylase] ligase [Candidatus Cyanaurora vandensis]